MEIWEQEEFMENTVDTLAANTFAGIPNRKGKAALAEFQTQVLNGNNWENLSNLYHVSAQGAVSGRRQDDDEFTATPRSNLRRSWAYKAVNHKLRHQIETNFAALKDADQRLEVAYDIENMRDYAQVAADDFARHSQQLYCDEAKGAVKAWNRLEKDFLRNID